MSMKGYLDVCVFEQICKFPNEGAMVSEGDPCIRKSENGLGM
jgi:hypothetical protein